MSQSPRPPPGPTPDAYFVPAQKRRSLWSLRIFRRLAYYSRLPFSSRLTFLASGLLFICGGSNLFVYVWKGPGHPTNRFAWERARDRGRLTPEMLEKERMLYQYQKDCIVNPRDPLPMPRLF